MRPVNRGVSPYENFSHYRDAAQSLIGRLGSYCSYCERHIETHLAVEHVSPKSVDPDREKDWDNFLLGCINCNSSKGMTSINASDYFWPDLDNTLKIFSYLNAVVASAPGLSFEQQQRADSLIRLVGLDRHPGNLDKTRRPSASDRRWIFRKDIWGIAQQARQRLCQKDSSELREQVVETALGRGGFGIWFTVFADDEDMCQRLVSAFPGTAKYYFGEFKDLAVPVHVLRVLAVTAEEIIQSSNKYIMEVVVPENGSYQRVGIKFIDQSKSVKDTREFINPSSLLVWISMIEYAAISTISRHKITVVVFERRQPDASAVTTTRHYVQPSYEGKNVAEITFRNMTSIAKDINNFFATGTPPAISGQ
jgi:uncharacterized protein (TIGR02646 family)